MSLDDFQRLSQRLCGIQLGSGRTNSELIHCLSVFETYVYGVVTQYRRINEKLAHMREVKKTETEFDFIASMQVHLDIYYYTLNFDKLSKIFIKIKELINKISRNPDARMREFLNDYKVIRGKIERLFEQVCTDIRNEYEHPSLEAHTFGKWLIYNILSVKDEEVEFQFGNEKYVAVRKSDVKRLNSLWMELIDTFIKHFSDKPPIAGVAGVNTGQFMAVTVWIW
jgi:hypothetical protein